MVGGSAVALTMAHADLAQFSPDLKGQLENITFSEHFLIPHLTFNFLFLPQEVQLREHGHNFSKVSSLNL